LLLALARTSMIAERASLANFSSVAPVVRAPAALPPDSEQNSAVAAVAHGSGTVVLPASIGTATAHASASRPSVRCARHTAARRILNVAERL
jgi:hypothetical protein